MQDIFTGSERVGQTLANRYREDLRQAGFGSGHHGFEFAIPTGLAFGPAAVSVRRAIDVARLPVLPASVYARTPARSAL